MFCFVQGNQPFHHSVHQVARNRHFITKLSLVETELSEIVAILGLAG